MAKLVCACGKCEKYLRNAVLHECPNNVFEGLCYKLYEINAWLSKETYIRKRTLTIDDQQELNRRLGEVIKELWSINMKLVKK